MNDCLSKLKEKFKNQRLDAVLVSSIPNIIYLTNFVGFSKEERDAFLFVAKDKQYILTDGRYSEAVKTKVKDFELIEISSKLSFGTAVKQLAKKHHIKRLGFEGDNISFLEHKKIYRLLNDLNHFTLSRLRIIKSPPEIMAIEKACGLGDKTFDYVLKKTKLGISEKEVANEIEFFIKKHGADISFRPIIAFGKNSAIPHHQPSDRKLEKSDKFVLLDFGVKLNNYCSDMTRTISFGKPTPEQKKMYETVLETQRLAIEKLNILISQSPNIQASKIDKVARDYITSKGYPSIPHSLGHGIGLEVHESPRFSPTSKDILKEGTVFSIEPGIYIPNFGGVRIEDIVVLEKSGLPRRKAGPRLLTHSPKQLIEL